VERKGEREGEREGGEGDGGERGGLSLILETKRGVRRRTQRGFGDDGSR
jgi:hypothetical protein